jgi:hypothetical protein
MGNTRYYRIESESSLSAFPYRTNDARQKRKTTRMITFKLVESCDVETEMGIGLTERDMFPQAATWHQKRFGRKVKSCHDHTP